MSLFNAALAVLNRQCASVFGAPIQYTPADAEEAISLRVVELNSGRYVAPIEGPQYVVVWVNLADVPDGVALNRGDSFEAGGKTYVVTDVQLDGDGGMKLVTDQLRGAV